MRQQAVKCPECYEEFMISVPSGRHLGGAYVTIGYLNAGAVDDLEHAAEIVQVASEDLPFRADLARAAQLLRRVSSQLEGIAEE